MLKVPNYKDSKIYSFKIMQLPNQLMDFQTLKNINFNMHAFSFSSEDDDEKDKDSENDGNGSGKPAQW